MTKIEVLLDERVQERARRLAESRRCSLDDLVRDVLVDATRPSPTHDRLLGLFGDEPELVDAMVDAAVEAWERHSL